MGRVRGEALNTVEVGVADMHGKVDKWWGRSSSGHWLMECADLMDKTVIKK